MFLFHSKGYDKMNILTPIKAIRAKCLDCCCDSVKEVRLCPITNCALYPYRLGHRPKKDKSDITTYSKNPSKDSNKND